MNKCIYKKRIRLKNFNYIGNYRYFVTITVFNKQHLFVEKNIIDCIKIELKKLSSEKNFKVWAYCFMPDHLHFLIEGISEKSDFKKFITKFKQLTGFRYKQKYKKNLWQINYYEHILRKEEDTKEVVYYIFNNPVRKGLVNNYLLYPFIGSFEITDLSNL